MKLIKVILLILLGSSLYLTHKYYDKKVVFKPSARAKSRTKIKNNRVIFSLFTVYKK